MWPRTSWTAPDVPRLHRAVGIADLLTASLAAAHQLTAIHYDADFDTAATVLRFQHRWPLPTTR
ncbi:MAG: hypothetical protein WB989_09040 [Mycobacterium sp.]